MRSAHITRYIHKDKYSMKIFYTNLSKSKLKPKIAERIDNRHNIPSCFRGSFPLSRILQWSCNRRYSTHSNSGDQVSISVSETRSFCLCRRFRLVLVCWHALTFDMYGGATGQQHHIVRAHWSAVLYDRRWRAAGVSKLLLLTRQSWQWEGLICCWQRSGRSCGGSE